MRMKLMIRKQGGSVMHRVGFFVVVAVMLTAPTATAEWRHYVVDSVTENLLPRVRMQGRVPHIAFYSDAGLEYAVRDSTGWVSETIDVTASSHNGNPALEFDREGKPHIAYFRGTPWYARWDGSTWLKEEIDSDPSGDYISMVLDDAGSPRVAYSKRRGMFGFMLKFAERDSQGWHPALLDSVGGADCVLAIDTLGRFCISHCQSWSSGALFFTAQTESGWVKETVVPDNASQSKMVLDESGNPHISYFGSRGDDGDLCYAERVGGAWRTDIVDPGPPGCKRGWDNWIARDRSGTYHISYHAHNEGQLRYARGTYGNWQSEFVNSVGGWNVGSSIDLDELDRPVIAYVHEDQAFRLYLSAAYDLTGVEDPARGGRAKAGPEAATIIRGALRLPVSLFTIHTSLFDMTGRQVMVLHPGTNDVRALAPGVYFVREQSAFSSQHSGSTGVRKVVVQR